MIIFLVKHIIYLFFGLMFLFQASFAQTPKSIEDSKLLKKSKTVTVFENGESGYASFRIPAIIRLFNGDLLAFAEGRVANAGDFGNVDIVYKRSKNQGKTWSNLQKLIDNTHLQAGNPAPVVDLLDPNYPKGRVFLYYNTGNNHESEVRKGNGLREVWVIHSSDQGLSWSEPENISLEVHKPNQTAYNKAYDHPLDWRTYANTPGHAIQMINGPYKGRIYVAANHSVGSPRPGNLDYVAHAFYTDDHGKTYKLAQDVPFQGSNESMAAQISATEVYLSSRNQSLKPKNRIISRSNDGGETWYLTKIDTLLIDPVNQASVLSWNNGNEFILAHLNAAHTEKRDRLTLRISYDKGYSWSVNHIIAESPSGYKGDYSAYSDMVKLDNRDIGIIFEFDNYKQIIFQKLRY